MNDIITKRSDKVLVQNRPLQVVNKLSTMIKDVIFAVFFQYLYKSFGYVNARTFFQLFDFTNEVIISGHGNESCLHKFRATTDMRSIAVRTCMLQRRKCSLQLAKVHEVLIYNSCHLRQSTQNYWEGVFQSSASVLITPWTNSLSVHLLLQIMNVYWRFR